MASSVTANDTPSEAPPAKRFKPDYCDTVTVLAGAEEQLFTVHKEVLCQKASFFVAACSSAWKEGKEGRIHLPTVEAPIFKLYVHSLYTGGIEVDILDMASETQEPASN